VGGDQGTDIPPPLALWHGRCVRPGIFYPAGTSKGSEPMRAAAVRGRRQATHRTEAVSSSGRAPPEFGAREVDIMFVMSSGTRGRPWHDTCPGPVVSGPGPGVLSLVL
jgi:hypothetical protein